MFPPGESHKVNHSKLAGNTGLAFLSINTETETDNVLCSFTIGKPTYLKVISLNSNPTAEIWCDSISAAGEEVK